MHYFEWLFGKIITPFGDGENLSFWKIYHFGKFIILENLPLVHLSSREIENFLEMSCKMS